MGARDRQAPQPSVGWFGLLVAVLVGTWVGHAVEYFRVWGSSEFANSSARTAHAYFGPIGFLLAVSAAGWLYASMALARRLRQRTARIRAALLGARPPSSDRLPPGRWTPSFPTLWATLWIGQLIAYVIQENLEAHAAGIAAPGLGAITGIHALAPLVHLAVAGVGAGVVWITRRRLAGLASELRQALQSLARRLRPATSRSSRPSVSWAWTPRQRWGVTLWARPPPRLSA